MIAPQNGEAKLGISNAYSPFPKFGEREETF